MAKPRNDLIDRLQYVGLRVASMLMHCWPVNLNLKLARMLGDAVYTIDKKHRQRAIYNVRRSFPGISGNVVVVTSIDPSAPRRTTLFCPPQPGWSVSG